MSNDYLQRLETAIKKADEAGNTEDARKLVAEYRRVQTESQSSPQQTAPEGEETIFSSFGNAWRGAVDPVLESMGSTAEVFGKEKLADTLRGATTLPENYVSGGDKFMNPTEADKGFLGFDWSYAPEAIAEQTGQFAGSVASRAAGAAGGAMIGSALPGAGTATGAVAGGLAGPALFEAMQVIGPVAQDRARADGRDTPNAEDMIWALGTAGVSGGLNAIAPGASGIVRRMLIEGGTEGVQSLVQQTGSTAQTEQGLTLDPHQALGEGILGAGSAGTFDAGIHAGGKALSAAGETLTDAGTALGSVSEAIRYDKEDYTESDARTAERLREAAEGDMSVLGNVDTDKEGSAKGASKAALSQVRTEVKAVAKQMRALAKATGNTDGELAVDTLAAQAGNQTIPTPDTHLEKLRQAFPDNPDVERMATLIHQVNRLQDFTKGGTEDMGGISQFTRLGDIFDKRNTMKAWIVPTGVGFGGLAGGPAGMAMSLGGGAGLNRAARVLDKLTNRRSRVKRFVDSVEKFGPKPTEIKGTDSKALLDQFKAAKAAEKAVSTLRMKAAKEAHKGGVPIIKPGMVDRFRIQQLATEDLFKEGAVVPEPHKDSNPTVQGHYMWQQATGLSPVNTYQVLQQLEAEGEIPQGFAKRFRSDIGSFKKDPSVPDLQRLVAQRGGGDPKQNFRPKPPEDTSKALDNYYKALTFSKDRRTQRRLQGQKAFADAVKAIDKAGPGLSVQKYQDLLDLAQALNEPSATRADRFDMLNSAINDIFRTNAEREVWKRTLSPLAAAGNDIPIYREEAEADPVEEAKTEELTKKKKAAKKKAAPRKASPTPEPETVSPKTPAEQALEKLQTTSEKSPSDTTPEPMAEVEKVREAETPVKPARKTKAHKTISEEVEDLIEKRDWSVVVAGELGPELQAHIDSLPSSTEARIEKMIYDMASGELTVNQLVDTFAQRFEVPAVQAANIVNNVLSKWEGEGKVKRISRYRNNFLKFDGRFITGEDGKNLHVLHLEITDQDFKERYETAKAMALVDRMVPAEPQWDYDPNRLQVGAFEALKDIPRDRVDGTYTPLLDFINDLRHSTLSVNDTMLGLIEKALGGTGNKRVGTVGEVLKPKGEDGRPDKGPLRTVAQLLWAQRHSGSNLIRQEWKAGANGRVYSINGLAHTQAGDIMKGILRAPDKAPVGGQAGLDYLYHGLGNLLGYDKDAPADRRKAIFNGTTIDDLITFASDPFKRQLLKKEGKDGETTRIGQMVDAGEGFFQVLNAGLEVKSMVDWARARHTDKGKLSNADLLSHPEVRADLANNYETDFIVQLDASNNAYQIAGMTMGDTTVLQSTGLLPPEGETGDPDQRKGGDIYMGPALAVTDRVPELDVLGLPDSLIRKVFKKPIGTFLYAAEYNSRKEAFRKELTKIADGANLVGIDGDGLIEVPSDVVSNMKTPEGHVFDDIHFDQNGDIKSEGFVTRKVVKSGEGWIVAKKEGNGNAKFTNAKKRFNTPEDAIKSVYEENLYTRMNRELIREMNVQYPNVLKYIRYADVVAKIVKERGGAEIAVPTRDGITLHYSFKEVPGFTEAPIDIDGKVVRLGVRTPDMNLAGRGLAAFMTHQNDAWALREVHRRMKTQEMVAFNPIHDSFGFHPSDAPRGQETWVKVMQELGSPDYNLFVMILEANGISLEEFVAAGGDPTFIVGRQGVAPVPAKQIPTALS